MNALLPWKDIVRAGGFTTGEAARLIGSSAPEVASWLRGKVPLILPDYEPLNGRLVLSFDALIEARAVSHFLNQGMSRAKLRSIISGLRKRDSIRHPLARDQNYVTDGFRLFEKNDEELINLANEVYADPDLMRPALTGKVSYESGKAAFLVPAPADAPLVRIDPRYAFGKPVVIEGGRVVTTAALASEVTRGGPEGAADWYGVTPAAASQAAWYEEKFAA